MGQLPALKELLVLRSAWGRPEGAASVEDRLVKLGRKTELAALWELCRGFCDGELGAPWLEKTLIVKYPKWHVRMEKMVREHRGLFPKGGMVVRTGFFATEQDVVLRCWFTMFGQKWDSRKANLGYPPPRDADEAAFRLKYGSHYE